MSYFFKKSAPILGMNARNLDFIRPYNLKKSKKIADDKLWTKRLLKKQGLPVPELIAKIETYEELENFDWSQLPATFALKPNKGFGGSGILVVYGKSKKRPDTWIKADGSLVTIDDIKAHIRNILDGSFSLSNIPDVAFFEERLRLHKLFKPYSYRGIPDVRVIVFNQVPVMAMLRLATKESGGKANLQLGAIGVGIDLASGTTTTAVYGERAYTIDYVPKTRLLLSGIKIPYWKEILHLAIESQKVSHLGYLGADIAIDREKGPVFLELNARPGLQIQIANLGGLKDRLQRVSGLKIKSTDHGIRVGMNLFGGEVEEELEGISGKKIISTTEMIKFISKDGKEIEVKAKIDTGAYSTSIDTELAKKLGFSDVINTFDQIDPSKYALIRGGGVKVEKEVFAKYTKQLPDLTDVATVFSASGASIRPIVKLPFIMDKTEVISKANIIDRSTLQYKVLIGRKDLKKFLIEV